jgi:hypothetical protein
MSGEAFYCEHGNFHGLGCRRGALLCGITITLVLAVVL